MLHGMTTGNIWHTLRLVTTAVKAMSPMLFVQGVTHTYDACVMRCTAAYVSQVIPLTLFVVCCVP